jgi:type II secretion system protein N
MTRRPSAGTDDPPVECLAALAIVPRPVPVEPPPRAAPPPRRPRWRRWLAVAGGVIGVLAIAITLAFPTDAVVRGVLARVTPPSGPFVVFRRAVLRPWGLRLDGPALRRLDGTAIVDADWVRVRPSVLGLFRDGTGRPWRVASGVCGGTFDADVTVDRTAASIDASWTDLDLGVCLPPLAPGLTLAGRVSGQAVAQAGNGVRPSGHGELRLRDAVWQQDAPPVSGLDTLHVDAATLRWTVDADRLTVEGLELRGPELELRGGGTVRLTGSPSTNVLDLQLIAVPGAEAPEPLLRLLDQLPRAPGGDPVARSLVVKGTGGNPRVVTR